MCACVQVESSVLKEVQIGNPFLKEVQIGSAVLKEVHIESAVPKEVQCVRVCVRGSTSVTTLRARRLGTPQTYTL